MSTLFYKTYVALNDNKIKELEAKYNVKLPEDYKKFLMTTGGGYVDSDIQGNAIEIPQANDVINISHFFGYSNELHDGVNIEWYMEEFGDELFEGMLIIGTTLQHGMLLLECDNSDEDEQGIWYWDDCRTFERSSDEENTYFIADTFTELIEKLEGNLK